MSQKYPDLTYTSFPERIDTINNFVDITLATLPLAKEYYAKYNAGDIIGANKIIDDNPQLKYSQINASTLNPIVDSIKAMQRFYMSDVQQYLMEIVKPKGEWSASIKYLKYNTVTYVNNSAFEVFMCASSDTPIGTVPTDTTYWIPLTMRGEKGEAGIGLTAYGGWNSVTTYPKDALVAYNNALWGSKVSNTAIVPSINATATWYLIIDYSGTYANFKDRSTQKIYQLAVDNQQIFMENRDNTSEKINVALKSDIPTSLPANGGNSTTVNNHTVNSDVPANAKFTDTVTTINGKTGAITKADIVALGIPSQDTVYNHPSSHPWSMITGAPTSYPANGGNSNTVNGFSITTQTTIPSSLTTNVICLVYE